MGEQGRAGRFSPWRICGAISRQDLFGLSLPLKWPRQCDSVENLADKEVSLNGS